MARKHLQYEEAANYCAMMAAVYQCENEWEDHVENKLGELASDAVLSMGRPANTWTGEDVYLEAASLLRDGWQPGDSLFYE